jgi:predicted membrane protein
MPVLWYILIYNSFPTFMRPDLPPMNIFLTKISLIIADFAGLQHSTDVPTCCMELKITALMLQYTINRGDFYKATSATEATIFFLMSFLITWLLLPLIWSKAYILLAVFVMARNEQLRLKQFEMKHDVQRCSRAHLKKEYFRPCLRLSIGNVAANVANVVNRS